MLMILNYIIRIKDPDIVEAEINKDLDRANTWFTQNGIKVNPTKHQAVAAPGLGIWGGI